MAGEQDLWCLSCGLHLEVMKNGRPDVANWTEHVSAWLVAHETTNDKTHLLAVLATSDVDAGRIDIFGDQLPYSVQRIIDA